MLRIPGVILLALCVLAMPSYAAITCGSACAAAASDVHQHDCCPDLASVDSHAARAGDADGSPGSNHSDSGRHHHCTAPCCGFVAHVLMATAPHADERPLADLLPSAAALQGAVDHDAIFHPPRL